MDFNNLHELEPAPKGELDARQRAEAVVKPLPRPEQPIFFHRCNQLSVEGLYFRDSPCWTLTFSDCVDVKVRGITIDNDLRYPNNDGLHFCSSKDVVVSDCNLSAGDDCISISGITDWAGISERIVINNCIMRSRSRGINVGYRASKVREVSITNLVIYDSNRGIEFLAGEDGWVEDVVCSNLVIKTRIVAGSWWAKGEPLLISAANSTGWIRNVSMRMVHAEGDNGILIVGHKKNVRNITLTDWSLILNYGKNRPLYDRWIDLRPEPVRYMEPGKLPWLLVDDAQDVLCRGIQYCRNSDIPKEVCTDALIQKGERVKLEAVDLMERKS